MLTRSPEVGVYDQDATILLAHQRLRKITDHERLAFTAYAAGDDNGFEPLGVTDLIQARTQGAKLLGCQRGPAAGDENIGACFQFPARMSALFLQLIEAEDFRHACAVAAAEQGTPLPRLFTDVFRLGRSDHAAGQRRLFLFRFLQRIVDAAHLFSPQLCLRANFPVWRKRSISSVISDSISGSSADALSCTTAGLTTGSTSKSSNSLATSSTR